MGLKFNWLSSLIYPLGWPTISPMLPNLSPWSIFPQNLFLLVTLRGPFSMLIPCCRLLCEFCRCRTVGCWYHPWWCFNRAFFQVYTLHELKLTSPTRSNVVDNRLTSNMTSTKREKNEKAQRWYSWAIFMNTSDHLNSIVSVSCQNYLRISIFSTTLWNCLL